MATVAKIRELWDRLTPTQRFRIGFALVATLALVWGFTIFVGKVRYGVLYTNLAPEDAAAIVAELRSRNVPHRVSAGGSLLEVPVDRIDDVRMELAGEGVTPGAGSGFELFDKPAFGLSDFVQNVNYQRALERELGRTIQGLDSVAGARVHLALPPETLFAEEQRKPSASVVLRLRAGRAMREDGVRAIGNLVASGVEGLDPASVSIIDSQGRMLAGGEDVTQRFGLGQNEAKRDQEEQLEQTLVALIEPIVGAGKVRARATVELTSRRVDRVEELYDPDAAVVRSEQKTKSSDSSDVNRGVPGTTSNLPGAAPPTGGAARQSQTTVTNFELNKTVATISEPAGTIRRLSVAVVVDHATSEQEGADGTTEPVAVPRSAGEMQQITDLVRAAMGYDEERRDVLIVENVPFESPAPVGESGFDLIGLIGPIMRFGSLPLAVLLLVLFVFRPAIAVVRTVSHAPAEQLDPALAPTIAQLQAQLRGGGLDAGGALLEGISPLKRKLLEAIEEDPKTAALVVRGWMQEER